MKFSYQSFSLALLYAAALACVLLLLGFNGLYGQDAHEYLRQSLVIVARWQGEAAPPPGLGDREMAGGYPFVAAIVQVIGLGAIPAMQLVSALAGAGALWVFERLLAALSPGTSAKSRWWFALIGLGLAPYFFRAAATAMTDALGLLFFLAALLLAVRWLERERGWTQVAGFAALATGAVSTRYALVVALAIPSLALALEMARLRRWGTFAAAAAAALLASLPFWWHKGGLEGLTGNSLLADWSVVNFFKSSFTQGNGTVDYGWPNLAYLLFPLAHPGFCLSLPALFFLFKKTDVQLYAKRLIALTLLVYLLFLGGLAHQNMRYLLPAYALLLLALFPAWDRFFSYGFYFFKKLTFGLLGLTVAFQLAGCILVFRPVFERNRLEIQMANQLNTVLRPGDVLYGFDFDIALKSYLPQLDHRSLWLQEYARFQPGSYLLFNEPRLRTQWAGHVPMRNWERANEQFVLQPVADLPDGWTLFELTARR